MTVLVGNHDFLTGCKLNGDSVLNAEFCLEYVEISTNGVSNPMPLIVPLLVSATSAEATRSRTTPPWWSFGGGWGRRSSGNSFLV